MCPARPSASSRSAWPAPVAFIGEALGSLPQAHPAAPAASDAAIWEVLELTLARLDDAGRARLLEVVLGAAHPARYRLVAPILRSLYFPHELEAPLIAALTGDAPRARRNARELAYFLFAPDPDYRPSPALEEALGRPGRDPAA